ncbi:MAG: glycosyltransferase 87 family protein [Cyclobacteriaceae bacterium]
MPRQKPLSYFLFLVALIAYGILAYSVPRYETTQLFALYFLLFGSYVWMLKSASDKEIKFWIIASVIFRLSLLIAIPSLSDDFYRFIWDGRLIDNGFHPFAELPGFYLKNGFEIPGINESLYGQLNSPEYFTIYPPFAQFIFWVSVWISPQSILGSVIVMKSLIIAVEVGSIVLIQKLLARFNVNAKNVLIYALNPLVILELTGNLHFEAFVIFFILLALYLLLQNKIWQSGIAFAFSVAAKLLPIILLPLFFIRLGFKRSLFFYGSVLGGSVILFFPLLNSQVLAGFSESFALYFKSFEFNASIYYLLREFGYWVYGYNIIQTAGWKLGLISTIMILLIALWPFKPVYSSGKLKFQQRIYKFPDDLATIPSVMMWIMLTYFLFTTTLHPWYITTLLMFSLFTSYRFVVIWSGLIFLTYAGYTRDSFAENLYLTLLEYVVVIGYLVYELIWRRKHLSY